MWFYLFKVISGPDEGYLFFCPAANYKSALSWLTNVEGWKKEELQFVDQYNYDESEAMGYDVW